MNRVKLVVCPYCKVKPGDDCLAESGRPRRNPFSRKIMQHRLRIELARQTVGLVPKGEQPEQLREHQRKQFDFIAATEELSHDR